MVGLVFIILSAYASVCISLCCDWYDR